MAYVIARGDAERGDVLVKVAPMDGTARGFVRGIDMEGRPVFVDLRLRGVGEGEREVDAYAERARSRDGDLWIIEIEDREGRHFLTEPVEGPEPPGG